MTGEKWDIGKDVTLSYPALELFEPQQNNLFTKYIHECTVISIYNFRRSFITIIIIKYVYLTLKISIEKTLNFPHLEKVGLEVNSPISRGKKEEQISSFFIEEKELREACA